jgi:hypothetical protein
MIGVACKFADFTGNLQSALNFEMKQNVAILIKKFWCTAVKNEPNLPDMIFFTVIKGYFSQHIPREIDYLLQQL